MRKIDYYLMDILEANDNEWLKRIMRSGKIKVEPFAFIGNKRNADYLVTIMNYHGNRTQKVAVEIENDRDFDADRHVCKIKKDQSYPTIAIIPKEYEKDARHFQKSLIKVWLYDVKCKWKCDLCDHVSVTISSIPPDKCEKCRKGGHIHDEGIEYDDHPFVEAKNNPSENFGDIQAKLTHKDAWLFG